MKLDAAIDYSIQRSTTKDLKPLKPKHIQNITMATAQRDVQMSDLFKSLGGRMKESSSIVALKSLLLTHIMIREGSHERVLGYLASNPGLIDVYHLKDKHDQLKNVREYSAFLEERVSAYKSVKEDFVKGKTAMITYYKQEPLDEEKLKTIQSLQKLIMAGIKCDCFVEDWQSDNPIQIQAFRLIVGDMIGLFHLLNEAVLRLLAGFFELDKSLAKLGLEIYKSFAEVSKKATVFFEQAGRVSAEIGVRIPSFKQAPASLVNTLSDHINAPNFEEQRVIAREQRALKAVAGKKSKKTNKSKGDLSRVGSNVSLDDVSRPSSATSAENTVTEKSAADNDLRKKMALKADPVLIDFFASIDDEVKAFESENNQAQYGDIGGVWYPQQFVQDHSPVGSTFGLAENSKAQNQIQKQLEQTERMFASAGFSLQQPGLGFPPPLSNQSSFNGIPSNVPEGGKIASNPFTAVPTFNPAAQSFQQAQQPMSSFQPPGNSYQQSFGQSQFGQLPVSGMQQQSLPNQPGMFQAQPYGASMPQSFVPANTYMNPFSVNDSSKKQPSSTPFNPFGATSNPSSQSANFQLFGNNIPQNTVPFSSQIQPQQPPYATLPRSDTAQSSKPSQPASLFGDLASLDLTFNSKPVQNNFSSDPFSGNMNNTPFAGQRDLRNAPQHQQTFAPVNGNNAVQFGGMQIASDPFNPFGITQNVSNPQASLGSMPASNPFGNIAGGNLRTASNSNGNYIVSSSNAQPQGLFEPRSAPGAPGTIFTKPTQGQDLFAQDPFAIPFKNNSNNPLGFQQK